MHTTIIIACSGLVLARPVVQIYQHDIESSIIVVPSAQHPRLDLPTAPLTRHGDDQYYIDIKIGYPPVPVSISVDTGSSDTWVNAACQNCSFKPCKHDNICLDTLSPTDSDLIHRQCFCIRIQHPHSQGHIVLGRLLSSRACQSGWILRV